MSCEVTVLYFARSAELAGLRTETISVPQKISSLQLWREIVKRHSREIMSEIEEEPKDVIQLKFEKLSLDEVAALVISPSCGAISFFVGTTRNNFEGKKVIRLEYEAYTTMAEAEAKKICKDTRLKWPSVKHIAIHHRLGRCMKRTLLGKEIKSAFGSREKNKISMCQKRRKAVSGCETELGNSIQFLIDHF
ncbi:molybdopterin synthase catalytic subunit isoform X2 [Erythrolamprus reginae]|uniref:molybdopterin synthase catalytic subunit isoform X2 n=1 Tax=Erythrolamprus reginae TaxID=121349 RepID=UPI00396C9A58